MAHPLHIGACQGQQVVTPVRGTSLPFRERDMKSSADDPNRDVGVDGAQEVAAGTATERR